MSTHNICFHGEIRKKEFFLFEKQKCLIKTDELRTSVDGFLFQLCLYIWLKVEWNILLG